jgi:hypothetical protein
MTRNIVRTSVADIHRRDFMFKIPEPMLSYWETKAYKKAALADLAEVERLFGTALPASYVEFVTTIGFVVFDDVPRMQMLRHFDYTVVPFPGNRFAEEGEIGQGNIAFFYEPDQIVKGYGILTEPDGEEDDFLPKFPRNYLPIGNDAGQGQILMEMGEHPGRIWYWPENDWAWGLEDNTWLGFVAENFEDFINGLRP